MPSSLVATRGLIWPVVVSLLYYDNVKGHLGPPAPAGYPVVCIPEPDSRRRFVTARLPLYVTLAFPAFVAVVEDAAFRWTSVEGHSQRELSFSYGPAMWSERPLGTRTPPMAKVSVTRVF
ncbi:hypothetical protein MRX96_032490 [Rhipicephalus microplus]